MFPHKGANFIPFHIFLSCPKRHSAFSVIDLSTRVRKSILCASSSSEHNPKQAGRWDGFCCHQGYQPSARHRESLWSKSREAGARRQMEQHQAFWNTRDRMGCSHT